MAEQDKMERFEPVSGLAVSDWTGPGYKPVVTFGNWCCAVLNHADKFAAENVSYVERHPNTDETFVLLDGEAELLIGESRRPVAMERCKVYNVAMGVWHQIVTRPGTRVLIVENADVQDERREIWKVKSKSEK